MALMPPETTDISTPPSPAPQSMGKLGWGAPEGGMGPEASDPQVKALQGVKMIEMGTQILATTFPELAGPMQAFNQQLQQIVPQLMSQQMTGAPTGQMMPPTPVPPGM